MKTRQPSVAGAFYPADAGKLEAALSDFLANAPERELSPKVLVVVPHAGYSCTGQTAATTAYRPLQQPPV